MVECYFDGSCEPVNPHGHTSYGALVKQDGVELLAESGYVGVGVEMSNNVGEYAGVIAVLRFLLTEQITNAVIYGDSKLVVKQLNGKWRAKGGLYLPYYKQAIELRRKLPNVKIIWIPREKNGHADWLSRQAIKSAPRSESREELLDELIYEQCADQINTRRVTKIRRRC